MLIDFGALSVSHTCSFLMFLTRIVTSPSLVCSVIISPCLRPRTRFPSRGELRFTLRICLSFLLPSITAIFAFFVFPSAVAEFSQREFFS
jgi:hypothetical protein